MPTKRLDRLMFAQGGLCFFCKEPIPKAEASVEHLVASANGGSNNDEDCVALFQKQISEQETLVLIERLREEGMVIVSGSKVSYKLPPKSA